MVNNYNKNNTNVFVLTNIYTCFSNEDQYTQMKYLMKNKNNLIIYDIYESMFIPSNEIVYKIKNLVNVKSFLINNELISFFRIAKIFLSILISRRAFTLYMDSSKTFTQLIFLLLFKAKNYPINGICFFFPFVFK